MATKENPARRSISHSGGGSQTTTVSTVNSGDTVPAFVHRREVLVLYANDESAASNTVQLEDVDPSGPTVVRSLLFDLASGGEVEKGEDAPQAGIFDVPSGHELRVTTGGDAEIDLEFADEQV